MRLVPRRHPTRICYRGMCCPRAGGLHSLHTPGRCGTAGPAHPPSKGRMGKGALGGASRDWEDPKPTQSSNHRPQTSEQEGGPCTDRECRTHPGWPGFESGLRHRHAVQTRPQPVASSSHPPGNRVPGGLQCFHSPQAEPLQMPTLPPSFRTTYLTRGPMGSVLMAQRRHRPAEETRGHPALHY